MNGLVKTVKAHPVVTVAVALGAGYVLRHWHVNATQTAYGGTMKLLAPFKIQPPATP